MSDNDIVVVQGSNTSAVVVIPQDQVVTSVVKEVAVATVEAKSTVAVENPIIYVVTVAPGGGGGGGCCIDDVNISFETTFSSAHIMELLYPFTLNSFTAAPSTTEMGGTVTSVTLTWATNYPPDTVSIDNGIGAVTLPATQYIHSGQTITTNRTYTITAVRNGVTKTASATVGFLNRIYWGVHTSQTTDEAIITTWTSVLSNSRARTITYNCSGGRYFHLAYPSRLGTATFSINNLTYSDVTLTVVPVTNGSGYTENYNVYYCNVIQYGAAITLVVS